MKKQLAVVILNGMFCLAGFLFTGCASMLYMGGIPDEHTPFTRQTLKKLKSTPEYMNATVEINRTMDQFEPRCLLFELTPLGIFGPRFNCPRIERVIVGDLSLSYPIQPGDVSVKGGSFDDGKIKFKYTEDGKGHELFVRFGQDFDQKLSKNGRAVAIEPEGMRFSIHCDKKSCTARAEPDIVSPEGYVALRSSVVIDQGRIEQIAEETRRQEEEERRREVRNISLRKSKRFESYGQAYEVLNPIHSGDLEFVQNPMKLRGEIIMARMKILQSIQRDEFLLTNFPSYSPYYQDGVFYGSIYGAFKGPREFFDNQTVDIIGEIVGTQQYTTTLMAPKTVPKIKIYAIQALQ